MEENTSILVEKSVTDKLHEHIKPNTFQYEGNTVSVVNFMWQEEFNDNYAFSLAEIIKSEKYNLIAITLQRVGITDKGITLIAKALENNKTVKTLDLQWNTRITDEGLKEVADMLVKNSTLETIYLEKPSGVTSVGAEYLAEKVFARRKNFRGLKFEVSFDEGLYPGVAEAYKEKLEELEGQKKENIVLIISK